MSFKINSGEIVGIVGESGCGKSTVCGLINGLVKPDKGEVLFNGENVLRFNKEKLHNYRKNVQTIFQDSSAAINPRFTIGNSIAEPLDNFTKRSKKEKKEEVISVLKTVGLNESFYYRYPRQLSGGQKQRVAIARAIVINPQFLLMDEITSSLDVAIQAQILNLILDLKEEYGLGGLFISHDIGVVKYMCDRVLVMYNGSIVEEIAGEKIKEVTHPYAKLLLNSIPHIDNNQLISQNIRSE